MKNFLIKRSPSLTQNGILKKENSERKGYSESGTKKPPSLKLRPGDQIYVAETNYGIYAKGKVVDTKEFKIFKDIKEIILDFENKKDAKYCFELILKLLKAKEKNKKAVLYFHEYFIEQKLLNTIIPLEGQLYSLKKIQSAFSELNEETVKLIENPNSVSNLKLNGNIPGALRQYLYSFFNSKYNVSTWIDIDHFVPKSIGGPGNILENLVPIGFSLNRYKSNSIPVGLFIVASKYEELKEFSKPEELKSQKIDFLKSAKSRDLASKIVEKVNMWEQTKNLESVRIFYKSVLEYHHPDYIKILDENIK